MFDSKKDIKWSEKDILDTLYLVVFGICLFELFLHTSYVSKSDNWIGTVILGSHKVWDRMIYSLTISVAVLRFSMQTGVTYLQRIVAWLILFVFSFHYFVTGMHLEVLVFGCLCIGAYNFSFPKIIKLYFFESLVLCVFVIALAKYGIIENKVYIYEMDRVRESLGFVHPNTLGVHTMTIIIAYFVWRKTRIIWIEIGIAAIIELLVYRVTISRSSFIGTMLFLLICVCYKLYLKVGDIKIVKTIYNLITLLMTFSVFIFGSITVLLSYFFSPEKAWMAKLDQWFSTRLSLGRMGFDMYNASLLGQKVKMNSEPNYEAGEWYFFLDSYYIRSIFEWGLIALAVFLLLYFMVSYRAKRLNEFLILSALSVLALHGMMEVCMSSLVYNPYLLFLMASVGRDRPHQHKGEIE